MKLLIVAEYIRRLPWSSSDWAVQIARGLAARGHEVLMACDGLDDPALLPGLRLAVRRPQRTVRRADPLGFQRWASALRSQLRDHVSLSLTPWCAGDVWIRLDADSAAAHWRAIRDRDPIAALLELAHRPWVFSAARAERRAQRAAGPARTLRFAAGAEEGEAHMLLYASRLPRPDGRLVEQWRAEARALLGINPGRPVLLLSAVEPDGPALEAFLAGVCEVRRRRPDLSPLVIAAGGRPHSVCRAARRAGCDSGLVRFIGATRWMERALAACDAAVVPWPDHGLSAGARFLADALRMGRPVLALRASPGAALLEPAHFGTAPLGLLAEAPTPEAWAAVLECALAEGWLPRAQAAARDAGPALSFDGLLDRLERHLAGGN